MPLHVLYSPADSAFVLGADGKPITTEKPSPTRDDAAGAIAAHHAKLSPELKAGAPAVPAGTHWMMLHDDIDGSGPAGAHLALNNKLGEPTVCCAASTQSGFSRWCASEQALLRARKCRRRYRADDRTARISASARQLSRLATSARGRASAQS